MDILPLGDSAVLINLSATLSPSANTRVVNLAEAIRAAAIEGVISLAAAACSVTVDYDPLVISFGELKASINAISRGKLKDVLVSHRKWLLPVCYDTGFARDQEDICTSTGLPWSEVVRLHTSVTYRVYMIGFLPGFAYLGNLPEPLQIPRKLLPSKSVASRSVAIANQFTAIYPCTSPGGWHIAGRTPVPLVQLNDREPSLLKAGDRVQFQEIDKSAFSEMESAIAAGKLNINQFLHE